MDTTHNPIGVLCCRALQRDSQRWRLILPTAARWPNSGPLDPKMAQ